MADATPALLQNVNGTNFICSGVLFGRDLVLTAAHCIYDRANNGFFKSIAFAPGRHRTNKLHSPYGVHNWVEATIYSEFASTSVYKGVYGTRLVQWDLAVVRLEQPVGDQAGWVGLSEEGCVPQSSLPVTSAGFPKDLPYGEQARPQCKLCGCAGQGTSARGPAPLSQRLNRRCTDIAYLIALTQAPA